MGTNDTLFVIYLRVAEGVRVNSGDSVDANEAIYANVVNGLLNKTYAVYVGGSARVNVRTDLNGNGNSIFIAGVAAGSHTIALRDTLTFESRPEWGITVTVTGTPTGGFGGISRNMIIMGLVLVGGYFVLGKKRIKW